MTKGDKIKLRAEIAKGNMQAMIGSQLYDCELTNAPDIAVLAIEYADALMAELGISMEDDK